MLSKAITTTRTRHQVGGHSEYIPEGTNVLVDAASNLPDSSPIKWWLSSTSDFPFSPELRAIADGSGIGLYENEVAITD